MSEGSLNKLKFGTIDDVIEILELPEQLKIDFRNNFETFFRESVEKMGIEENSVLFRMKNNKPVAEKVLCYGTRIICKESNDLEGINSDSDVDNEGIPLCDLNKYNVLSEEELYLIDKYGVDICKSQNEFDEYMDLMEKLNVCDALNIRKVKKRKI